MKNVFKKLSLFVMAFIAVVAISANSVKAQEFKNLDYKVVHSYNEYEEFLASDEYLFTETEPTENADNYYKLEVDEPGWFRVYVYHSSFTGNWVYMYTNPLMTKAVTHYRNNGSLSGRVYNGYTSYKMYLTKGTYYLNILTKNSAGGHRNTMVFAAFLPAKDICSVKSIEYNDDYTAATVYFDHITSDKYYVWKGKSGNESVDASANFDNVNWSESSSYTTTSTNLENNMAWKVLNEGWTITENGDYSIHFEAGNLEYENRVITSFTIDKIGTSIEPKTVKLNKTKATIKVGATLALKGTIKPANATLTGLKWKSSNTKVATVDKNGKVTAKKKGTCVVTVTTENGKKAKCKITVK